MAGSFRDSVIYYNELHITDQVHELCTWISLTESGPHNLSAIPDQEPLSYMVTTQAEIWQFWFLMQVICQRRIYRNVLLVARAKIRKDSWKRFLFVQVQGDPFCFTSRGTPKEWELECCVLQCSSLGPGVHIPTAPNPVKHHGYHSSPPISGSLALEIRMYTGFYNTVSTRNIITKKCLCIRGWGRGWGVSESPWKLVEGNPDPVEAHHSKESPQLLHSLRKKIH